MTLSERIERATQVLMYAKANPSTMGSADPEVYELLSVMLDAIAQLREELSELQQQEE